MCIAKLYTEEESPTSYSSDNDNWDGFYTILLFIQYRMAHLLIFIRSKISSSQPVPSRHGVHCQGTAEEIKMHRISLVAILFFRTQTGHQPARSFRGGKSEQDDELQIPCQQTYRRP